MTIEDERGEGSFTRRLVGRIPDVMNRALIAGTGALFLTEEGIRNMVSDLKLPSNVVQSLTQQADATKKELFRFVGQEIRSFMEQSNLSQEFLKALTGLTVDIHTTVRFVANEEGGVTPKIESNRVRAGVPGTEDEDEEPAETETDEEPNAERAPAKAAPKAPPAETEPVTEPEEESEEED